MPVRGLWFAPILAGGWAACFAAPITAGHGAANAFERIPDDALAKASSLRILFRHASVGTTIENGLDCLQGTRDHPAECATYPDYRYDRRAWDLQARGNSGWYGKVDDFVAETRAQAGDFDVFLFKFCYLDGLDGLMEPCGSPRDPAKIDRAWEYLRGAMEMLETEFPGKVLVWCTIPLTQVGQACTEELNGRIRSHCAERGEILFDIADLESHDLDGAHRTNASGWEIAVRELCGEQNPDAQACHPNWTGGIRIAKAFWWMAARIAGWSEAGGGEARFTRTDANADGRHDVGDAIYLLSHLFASGPPLPCDDAGDANDDGRLDLGDAIAILNHLFGGPPLPRPPEVCGADPDGDDLDCATFLPCE
ncbi:MAG: hypothetical protein JXP34_26705 [Planctomycetes bacterium]|nr:hypothetical protein [Planctomycetota bacterium]